MINYEQLRDLIIKPALDDLQLYSDAAVQLLLFTVASESDGGTYLQQIKGTAVGIYQIEPETYMDMWQRYLRTRGDLIMKLSINFQVTTIPSTDRLIYDLRYATAFARLIYLRVKVPLPAADDVDGLWQYYKEHYNTPLGKAKKSQAIRKYHQFVGEASPKSLAS